MKSLYLIFGLWILIGCFQSGEGVRGPRRQHNPRRQQDPSTLPHYLGLQPDPNGGQIGVTITIPLNLQPPRVLVNLPGFITGPPLVVQGTTEYQYQWQLTAPDPTPLSNPPTQLHSTEQANTKTDAKISNTTATTQNSTDIFEGGGK
ncbi:rCG60471 [Rattus norvegicus]|uniref:Submaxillary gland androgen regulated protein 3B n=2 Tax=Rattus norvegicus TaxID=10116 RepID=A0A0G2K4K1_RAT|nr:SMR1 protein isoform X1 [Rattus norvegicus]EDL88507.1 rCG60471 [Rattus norvegicus]